MKQKKWRAYYASISNKKKNRKTFERNRIEISDSGGVVIIFVFIVFFLLLLLFFLLILIAGFVHISRQFVCEQHTCYPFKRARISYRFYLCGRHLSSLYVISYYYYHYFFYSFSLHFFFR